MTREEIINALQDDKTMPFIQPDQLVQIVDFVSKNYKPSLPEGLEEAKEVYCDEHNDDCFDAIGDTCPHIRKAFIAGAEWQKKQDQSLIELAEDHAMLAGMNKMKEEMMEKAVETEVVSRITGSGLLPSVTFRVDDSYKEGDKVKIIIVK